ncbi:conjugative transposon protein TraM [Pedobacter hiemivivus]|uniref:Conjugative transposon protein TraM n=1 Tax=Pedobacter hiemivivus TaxID=2530454 RepID=A0A4R0NGA8_9SPHI|nr:conjugative transposon protein TraM [Pedobacter hiemivivus]TCC98777.1 conjugative transposon protein TraM [Pedobacter hiemivivus]
MNINFKQPKYVIPLLILPFLFLFFMVYKSSTEDNPKEVKSAAGMQGNIGEASAEVQKGHLSNKLDAYRNQYKEGDGNTAINPIAEERGLDSIDQAMRKRFLSGNPGMPGSTVPLVSGGMPYADQGVQKTVMTDQDRALATALSNLNGYQQSTSVRNPVVQPKEKDPMEIFKAQMSYMDSISKAADPEYQQQKKQTEELQKLEMLKKQQKKLEVTKADDPSLIFNTVMPQRRENFITAIIDENLTGYAGSRIRLRLLEDIKAGNFLVKKGTYLYAEINGFGGQRVTLSIQSILFGGKILPVNLDLYDMDGLKGLYVPESAFRDFTKDLGGNSMQGVNLQGSSQNQSQFLMSTIDKMFQSTSSAIASLIRKNKAKLKYSSYLYLIDSQALQAQQQNY